MAGKIMKKLFYILVACIFTFSLSACDEKKMAAPDSRGINQSISDADNRLQPISKMNYLKQAKTIKKNVNQSMPAINYNIKSEYDDIGQVDQLLSETKKLTE